MAMSPIVGRRSVLRAACGTPRRMVMVLGAVAGAALSPGPVLPTSAAAATPHGSGRAASGDPGGPHRDAPWARYVEGPSDPNVGPVSIVSISGDVRNASALLHPGHGAAELTRTSSDTGATDILLDYGKDVGGLPYFAVADATGSPNLHVSYSEGGQYADQPDGDTNP